MRARRSLTSRGPSPADPCGDQGSGIRDQGSGIASVVDYLVSLLLERGHPLLDTRARFRSHSLPRSKRKTRDVEQIVQLRIGQLHEEVRQKFSALLADCRVV